MGTDDTMSDTIDRMLTRGASPLPSATRQALWQARMNSPAGLFGSDRLRPSAGMANIVIGRSGFRADASGDLAAVGPAILRSFVAERRTWLSGHDTGREQIARPARDRAIDAARRLNEHGFAVGDAITDDGAARDVAAASAADNRLQGD